MTKEKVFEEEFRPAEFEDDCEYAMMYIRKGETDVRFAEEGILCYSAQYNGFYDPNESMPYDLTEEEIVCSLAYYDVIVARKIYYYYS